MIRLKYKYSFYFLILFTVLICSCANQLPPTGGEDDRTPPEIIYLSPNNNTTNFKDNKLIFKFDEYVDRRSFEEALFISPKPKGEVKFDWSGKEVEVIFSKPLEKNRTYVVILGKDLRDVRGGNSLSSPRTIAFSTGDKIDQGNFSGRVFSDNNDRVKILAYLKYGKTEDKLNPEKNLPDYVLQVSPDGSYELTNLPDGEYRIFAITDEDRNNFFNKDVDKISILSEDIKITPDSSKITNLNFLLNDFDLNKNSMEFLNLLKSDSADFIYSDLSSGQTGIPPDYKFYFYFKKSDVSKADIVNNFSLTDSVQDKSYRLVFNWMNDSLLEVFSTEKFGLSSELKLAIDLRNSKKNYLYLRRFTTAGKNNLGKVAGKIISKENKISPVYVKLYNNENRFVSYSVKVTDSSEFTFNEVLEGNYTLLSFKDDNENGIPDKGNYYTFTGAEKFIMYDKEIKIKGGWTVENIFLNY